MEYPCRDSKFKSSDHSIRLMQQIAKTKYVDEDYVEFLKLVYCYNKDSQSYTNEHGHDVSNSPNHSEDGDDDEVDPQYKKFLGNAKPDGRSYVVKFDTDDGFHVFVKYEREDGSDYVGVKQNDEVESRRFSATVMGNDRKRSIGDSDVPFEPFDPVTSPSGASKRQGKYCDYLCGKHNDEVESRRFSATVMGNDGKRSIGDSDVAFEPFDPVSQRKKHVIGKSGATKPGQEHTRRKPAVSVNVKEEVADDVDEDYLLLLKNLKCSKNWGMKASSKSGHSFEYEAAEDEYDAEIHKKNSGGIRKAGRSNPVNASSVKYHDIVVDKCSRRSVRSEFRRKVMDLVKKPYDQDEYKELWKEVSIRKLMQRNMDLRNGKVKFYQTKKMGKSLLDHYIDLDSKLKVVENDYRKKLNILRGFFFWLQNLTQENAFKPWNDVEFLTLVDES